MLQSRKLFCHIFFCIQSASRSGNGAASFKGAAFWEYFDEGQIAPAAEGLGGGLYGIFRSDTTFSIITSNAQAVRGCERLAPMTLAFLSHASFLIHKSKPWILPKGASDYHQAFTTYESLP